MAVCLIGLADVAVARGQRERALRLLAAAPDHPTIVGVVLRPMPAGDFADKVAGARLHGRRGV